MAKHLTPKLWSEMKNISTATGFTLDKAIQVGIENPSHPHVYTMGKRTYNILMFSYLFSHDNCLLFSIFISKVHFVAKVW